MKRYLIAVFFLLAPTAAAQQDSGLKDEWFIMRINGAKAGYVHEWRRTIKEADQEITRTHTYSETRINRLGTEVLIIEESFHDESADGRPLKLRSRSLMSRQETVYEGKIKGEKLELTITSAGTTRKRTLDWSEEYLFPVKQEKLMLEKGFTAGTTYSFSSFVLMYGKGSKSTVKIIGPEKIKIRDKERELVKAETVMDVLPGTTVTSWSDTKGNVYKTSMNLMGMKMVMERSDRATALLSETGDIPEVMVQTLLRPKKQLKDARKVKKAVYKITIKEGKAPADGLKFDGQTIEKLGDRTFKLTVGPVQPGEEIPKFPISGSRFKEYLEDTAFLQCKDEKVVAAAKEAVGDETDAWEAAKKIRRWVFENIKKKNFGVGMASAKEVAEDLEGDCSEHAVLSAAMARAVGIPARIAVGIVGVGEIFGGHMWTEVWVGRWVPMDATLKEDFFDATHIKMADSTASGTTLGEDLINILFYIGKIELEILEVEEK